jgi:hypothetical protein
MMSFRTPFVYCWQYSRRDNGSISNLRNKNNYFRSRLFLKELPKECVLGCNIRGPSVLVPKFQNSCNDSKWIFHANSRNSLLSFVQVVRFSCTFLPYGKKAGLCVYLSTLEFLGPLTDVTKLCMESTAFWWHVTRMSCSVISYIQYEYHGKRANLWDESTAAAFSSRYFLKAVIFLIFDIEIAL